MPKVPSMHPLKTNLHQPYPLPRMASMAPASFSNSLGGNDSTSPQDGGERSSAAWSTDDDERLMKCRASGMNWAPIASQHFPSKTANACRKRHERLMEKRNAESWEGVRLEELAAAYFQCREEMWSVLAKRIGEKWSTLETKCMEKGLKTLQSAARPSRRHRHPSTAPSTTPSQSHFSDTLDLAPPTASPFALPSTPHPPSSHHSTHHPTPSPSTYHSVPSSTTGASMHQHHTYPSYHATLHSYPHAAAHAPQLHHPYTPPSPPRTLQTSSSAPSATAASHTGSNFFAYTLPSAAAAAAAASAYPTANCSPIRLSPTISTTHSPPHYGAVQQQQQQQPSGFVPLPQPQGQGVTVGMGSVGRIPGIASILGGGMVSAGM